jgi:hypothetical protein
MLRCEECEREAKSEEEARRWRAYLTVVDDNGGTQPPATHGPVTVGHSEPQVTVH